MISASKDAFSTRDNFTARGSDEIENNVIDAVCAYVRKVVTGGQEKVFTWTKLVPTSRVILFRKQTGSIQREV